MNTSRNISKFLSSSSKTIHIHNFKKEETPIDLGSDE